MPIINSTKTLAPRRKHDHYPTNSAVARACLSVLPTGFTPRTILDHSAGTGVWGAVARYVWPDAYIVGIDLQPFPACPAYNLWLAGVDFLRYARAARKAIRYDLIMGNPPYGDLAEGFIEHAMPLLHEGGYLLHLQPTQFLASQGRGRGLWQRWPLTSVDTLSRRPSFISDPADPSYRQTDATDYNVYLWQKGATSRRYSGGWLDWAYAEDIPEDMPGRPLRLLAAPGAQIMFRSTRPEQLRLFEEVA